MNDVYFAFPGGRFKALTLSYDDGNVADRKLVPILDKHGLKCSFHLNGGLFGRMERIEASEVRGLYAAHEVSAHTYTHPMIGRCPLGSVARQILDDRKALEDLVGYPVRGMSYPFGSYSREIIELLPSLGIEYARAVGTTGGFRLPDDFLAWQGTCHHNDGLAARAKEFLDSKRSIDLQLMYVWGHSYEFEREGRWGLIEDFAASVGGRDDIWYATNIEIVDCVKGWKALRFSSDSSIAYNPSARSVWLAVGGQAVEVPGGQTVKLAL
jgi:peptidoglycan/xylan/chitin deacetylase (PgdA/CDA1 family)